MLSLTGPGAGLGIPERNTIELLPKTIAGQAVRWVVLDDASDTTAAVRAARKLIDEEHVDAILGPSTTPNFARHARRRRARRGVPFVSLAGSASVIDPPEGNRRWAFKLIPSERVATVQIVADMMTQGGKTLGQYRLRQRARRRLHHRAERAGGGARASSPSLEVRYNPDDTSVTPQVLRVIAAKPDAVFVAASRARRRRRRSSSCARAAMPGRSIRCRASPGRTRLRVGGKALDGVMFSSVPVLVAEQIAADNPVRAPALAYVRAYEGKYGPGSRSLFGATLWDGFLLVVGRGRAGAEGRAARDAGVPHGAARRDGARAPGWPAARRCFR